MRQFRSAQFVVVFCLTACATGNEMAVNYQPMVNTTTLLQDRRAGKINVGQFSGSDPAITGALTIPVHPRQVTFSQSI